jgi:hypothetical protein
MKSMLAILLSVSCFGIGSSWAAPVRVKGVVLETMNSGGYTYLRLKTPSGERWAAVNRANVREGERVTVENVVEMQDFESRSLKKTFPSILFGTLGGASAGLSMSMPQPRAGTTSVTAEQADASIAKTSGANARTVEEIVSQSVALKDKPVRVRAKVVKYNPGIMGKNWLHLRDGSGSAAAGSNDILVTTTESAKAGEIVTASGIVRLAKDFGAGYSYPVLVEEAKLTR